MNGKNLEREYITAKGGGEVIAMDWIEWIKSEITGARQGHCRQLSTVSRATDLK